jgi:hypothetical protein
VEMAILISTPLNKKLLWVQYRSRTIVWARHLRSPLSHGKVSLPKRSCDIRHTHFSRFASNRMQYLHRSYTECAAASHEL